jgi:predicted AAA+ superfamily ATPase
MHYIERFFTEPNRSYFLFGPRGVGKSTLMESRHKDSLRIDLLKPHVLRPFLARPERLYDMTEGLEEKSIIIDEIQKAPSLLSVVHSLIEEKRGLKFILTGSSARKLKRTGADLLGGRASRAFLHPFIAAELGSKFSLERALKYGLLPLIQEESNLEEALHGYINLYLQEEIQAEGLVRNIESFARFLEVITFSHAAVVNVANIARECEIKRKTVENYIQILEDLLLGFQLPVFTKRAQRELSAHPKFYLFDAGVYQTLRPRGPLDTQDEVNGAGLEGLIAQHLRAWNDYSLEKHFLGFWRTRSGLEVDFIVYGPEEFWAIEVKHAKQVSTQDVKGLEAFREDYPNVKSLLIYRGTEILNIKNVQCIPCELFLKQLIPNNTLWFDPNKAMK